MAEELRMALVDLLRKAGVEQADFLREGVRVLAQELMELEVAEQLGAEPHERTAKRTGYRNGYRDRPWGTRVGTIESTVSRARRQFLSKFAGTAAGGRSGASFRDTSARDEGQRPGNLASHRHRHRRDRQW